MLKSKQEQHKNNGQKVFKTKIKTRDILLTPQIVFNINFEQSYMLFLGKFYWL